MVDRNGLTKISQIIETEAYIGTNDLASHARFGRTPRTETMYGPAGHLYIYLIYGIYYLLNISTESPDFPAAVLIRSLRPIQNITSPINGPGKLCRELGLTSRDTGLDVVTSSEIYLTDSGPNPKTHHRYPSHRHQLRSRAVGAPCPGASSPNFEIYQKKRPLGFCPQKSVYYLLIDRF